MSRINNEFRLSGRMGGHLEKSFNPNNGNPIGRVSLAVDNSYTDRESGEIVERTTWLDLTFYNAKQIERLEKVFGMIDLTPRGKKCEAIDGILKEGDSVAEDYADTAALDAGLIAAAQAVEHYEITRYGTLRRWAKMLGMDEAASLLEQTLTEESETDDLLTQIADAGANKEALAEAKGDS